MKKPEIKMIPLDMILEPKKELRSYMTREKLEELSQSIKRYGLIQPITVRKKGEKYELVVGHRRFIASQMAGRVDIPAMVMVFETKDEKAITLEENLQREDVNSMDIAVYIESAMNEKNLTVFMVADLFNKSPEWVNSMLRLLNIDPMLQEAVGANQIPYASALEIQKIDNPTARKMFTESAVEGGASHRTIQNWVHSYRSQQDFQQKVNSGDYTEPSTIPVMPLTFICYLCDRRHDNNEMISVRVNTKCYQVMEQLKKIARENNLVDTEEE